jgi:hypothetical protein
MVPSTAFAGVKDLRERRGIKMVWRADQGYVPLVERLSDDHCGPFDSDTCGNDASNRENTQKLKEEKLASPFILRLHWRTSRTHPPRWVGCYRLDLRRLLEGGYMYRDPDGSPRLKIQHDGGEFYIRRRVSGPSVRLG